MFGNRSKGKCKILPVEVQKIIRSGVVISGFVKCIEELVYNGIDAEANTIVVRVNLDSFKLKVEDNGNGVAKEDLAVIGKRYYTSKIRGASDLTAHTKYGYRGEALASIIESSGMVEIMTRSVGHNAHKKRFKNGSEYDGPKKVPDSQMMSKGFVIYIENLLARNPVRQKRIEKNIEIEELKSCMETISLMNPLVMITLHDDASGLVIFKGKPLLSIQDSLRELVMQKQGVLHQSDVFSLTVSADKFLLEAVISQQSHRSRALQYLFVNRRFVPKSRLYRQIQDRISPILGFSTRCSTSSSIGSLENNKKKQSPVRNTGVERFPIFCVNITVAFQEYNLIMDGNKNKVEFLDLDKLLLALDNLMEKLKHAVVMQRQAKAMQHKGPQAFNRRILEQAEDEKEKPCAKRLGAGIGMQDSRRAVQSRPVVRHRSDNSRLSYEEPRKKARCGSKLEESETDSSLLTDRETQETNRDSGNDDDPFSSLEEFDRGPRKHQVTLKSKPKITHKLQKIQKLNITGLKRRKKERDSRISPDLAKQFLAAVSPKRPRLIGLARRKPAAALGRAPSSSPVENVRTRKIECDNQDSPGNDSDLSQSMISLSISHEAGSSAPGTRAEAGVNVREEFSQIIASANKKFGTPGYQTVKNDIVNAIKKHPKGQQMMEELIQELGPLGGNNIAATSKTPANAILRSRFPANYMQSSEDSHVGHKCKDQQQQQGSQQSWIGNKMDAESAAAGGCGESQEMPFANSQQSQNRGRIHLKRQNRDSGVLVQSELPQSHYFEKCHAKNSLAIHREIPRVPENEKRHGRYFNSQELQILDPHHVYDEQTDDLENVVEEPERHVDLNITSHTFKERRTRQWCNQASSRTLSSDPGIPDTLQYEEQDDGIMKNSMQRISSSTDDDHPYNQYAVSCSQQHPPLDRTNHQPVPVNVPDVCDESYEEQETDDRENNGGFHRRAEFTTPVQFMLEEGYLNHEDLRRPASDYREYTESPAGRVVIPTDQESCSKYFLHQTEPNVLTDSGELDINNGGANGFQDISPAVELDIPGQTTNQGSCCNQDTPGGGDEEDTSAWNKITPGNSTTSSMRFRNTWLKKVFPENACKFWNSAGNRNEKLPKCGNPDILLNPDSKLGECVSSFFAETSEDGTLDKWREGCKGKPTCLSNVEDAGNVPIWSLDSQELLFMDKKKMDGHRSTCRFNKDQLETVVIIGQVDNKFIAARMKFDDHDKLILFDQHAVHERIRLERLLNDAYEQSIEHVKAIACVEVQPPIVLNCTETEVRIMGGYEAEFALVGTVIEVVGPTSVQVKTAPKCFHERICKEPRASRDASMAQLLHNLLEEQVKNILEGGVTSTSSIMPKAILNMLKSQACKGAIKFGDPLPVEVCEQLLQDLKTCKVPFQCAHGRPVLMPLVDL